MKSLKVMSRWGSGAAPGLEKLEGFCWTNKMTKTKTQRWGAATSNSSKAWASFHQFSPVFFIFQSFLDFGPAVVLMIPPLIICWLMPQLWDSWLNLNIRSKLILITVPLSQLKWRCTSLVRDLFWFWIERFWIHRISLPFIKTRKWSSVGGGDLIVLPISNYFRLFSFIWRVETFSTPSVRPLGLWSINQVLKWHKMPPNRCFCSEHIVLACCCYCSYFITLWHYTWANTFF